MNGLIVARLNAVDGFIRAFAWRFSNGDLMLAEDLQQEARMAAYKRLQEAPDCPESHLVVKAKDAIYKYRRRGSSVDGKLNPSGRSLDYSLTSLQESIDGNKGEDRKEEIIGDPRQGRRPTEVVAITITLLDLFRGGLSVDENRAFAFRLAEIPWEEIEEILDQPEHEVYRIQTGIEEKALAIWERPEKYRYTPKREKRSYSRGPALPERIPPALLDVLTEQERMALAAYREGATQEEAAEAAGISQPTVSRLIAFVWENHKKAPEEIEPRTTRYRNGDRREQVLSLFYSHSVGELVTYEKLLELFMDVKDPVGTMWKTVRRCSKQLEGARIELVKGEGYVLVEEKNVSSEKVEFPELTKSPGA